MSKNPLILDVDGTLIRSDLTHELLLEGIKANPIKLPKYVSLGLSSKARMKAELIEDVGDDILTDVLPLEPKIIEMAKAAKEEGRDVYLCSGSEQSLIDRLAATLDFVTEGFGTTPEINLTSENKASFLANKFPEGFDYIGNSTQDYAVWDAAVRGHAIRPPRGTENRASSTGEPIEILESRKLPLRPIVKAMRVHQWAKNILIFLVPTLILDQLEVFDFVAVILGFLCLGLLASGTYLINDILDVQSDRQHPSKKNRPFAAGTLSIPLGILISGICVIASFGVSLIFLPTQFTITMTAYLVTTLAYSFVLKRMAIIDVITLAFLFMMRVAAGAAIVGEGVSPWLVSFILTFFLSLSLVKRYTEVIKVKRAGSTTISGRGYTVQDNDILLGYGIMATAMTLISFMLYGVVSSAPALKMKISVLIVGTIITYWLMRVWLLAHRGELNDDPVLFAIKDRISIFCGACIFLVISFEKVLGL